jgi:hypothetical protein
MRSEATTPEAYLAELPESRRVAISTLRDEILANLPDGVVEGMQYGMIGYFIPHSRYPNGYHCDPKQPLPVASIASQKRHMAFYSMYLYMQPDELAWFQSAWTETGHKLNMGKSCVRFTKIDKVPLEVIGESLRRFDVANYIASYEATIPASKR